jgi:two-component system response regulator DegU
MDQKIKIILAEDQELFRKSLISLLKTQSDFEVTADAGNGRDLLGELKQRPAHIVILDIEMPVMDGKTCLEIIRKRFPEIKVIVLSMHTGTELVSDFMSHGASSYLGKNCGVETLFKAIRVVMKEGYYFDNSTSKALLDTIMYKAGNESSITGKEVKFNDRETEILRKICDGKTNKEIASHLHLSTSTIDFHKSKIYSKTHCCNATELLKYALKNGIIALT